MDGEEEDEEVELGEGKMNKENEVKKDWMKRRKKRMMMISGGGGEGSGRVCTAAGSR